MPQRDLVLAQARSRGASVYSAFASVQTSRLRRDVSSDSDKAVGEEQASSRRALAFESEPCTMFSESRAAKSPRIVPGAESSGFVAPIIVADDRIADLAAHGEREHRPRGDEVDELAEERLALVLGVVLASERPVDLQQPRAAQLVAPALEARDDLAGEPRCMPSGLTRTRVVSTPSAA